MATHDTHFDTLCGDAIVAALRHMRDTGELDAYSRSQILNSDEAARSIIARLSPPFNAIDTNHFRRIVDSRDKRSEENGGLPRFKRRDPQPQDGTLAARVAKWADGRDNPHSDEYRDRLRSPEYREWRLRVMRRLGFQCAGCGRVTTGDNLEVHHYTYERLGHELDGDVCCVCSPDTGRPCHAFLDLLRSALTGTLEVEHSSLFDSLEPTSHGH